MIELLHRCLSLDVFGYITSSFKVMCNFKLHSHIALPLHSIVVGLNAVREICLRIPLLMTEDLLQDLVLYKKSHEKAVSSAACSLISLFREFSNTFVFHQLTACWCVHFP